MKKWTLILLVVLCIFIAGIYMLIPGTIFISTERVTNCAGNAAKRYLLDEKKWYNWWPREVSNDEGRLVRQNSFQYNGYTHHIRKLYTDQIDMFATKGSDMVNTNILIIPQGNSTVTLRWNCSVTTGKDPVQRLKGYLHAVSIRENINAILNQLQAFLENTQNVYGFPITEIISKDSTLIATKQTTFSLPPTEDIYRLIGGVKHYIAQQGATASNHPMLRVARQNDSTFNTMVAVPTDKKLDGNGTLFFQRFVPYKTLTCVVKGGPYAIDQGFRQMENYVEDHHRTPMAVPFQSLVTDRIAQPDTLKWITVICQPVS